ncbi:MAG TPA: putative zinc-binding protein [Spirochaetota bacterium]|nr:putative zinc-binding protein [Spirochaetota bacterium]HOL57023.1 putative zinc-binding protein [Spirochaetota bacterium]HPP04602.1 putative zinc-binding protein [Spirochaetota bacterium]
MSDKCCCEGGIKLVYACSGAANTGYLADRVSRKLMKEKKGSMTCLAAMGAELSGFIESAKSAEKNIVIDGCPVACGKKIFERLGLPYTHFVTTDFGVQKGKTEITEDLIDDIFKKISEKI